MNLDRISLVGRNVKMTSLNFRVIPNLSKTAIILSLLDVIFSPTMAVAAEDVSSICQLQSTLDSMLRSVPWQDFTNKILSKCKIGDVVSFPSDYGAVLYAVCDYSKSIVVNQKYVSCIVNPSVRATR